MNQKNHYLRTTCRACLSNDVELALPLPATPVGDAYQSDARTAKNLPHFAMDIYLCHSCGLSQLLDVVSPELLYGHFTYETSVSLGLKEHFKGYAAEVLSLLGLTKGATVVDIGSNDGTLLRAFKENGAKVLGVDPAKAVAAKATASGVETIPELFTEKLAEQLVPERGRVDLVVTNNTIANIDDLDDFLAGVKRLLKPEGVLILETGYGPDIIDRGLFETIYHEHLSYFSVDSFLPLLKRVGLKLLKVTRIDTKGGSIRAYIARATSERKLASDEIENTLRHEKAVKAREIGTFKALHNRLLVCKEKLAAEIGLYKAQGKTVAGFGASVSTTTFNYTFALGDKLDYLLDDNNVKFGKFSPGHGIPVFSSAEITSRKPAIVVVNAWRYAATIIEKNRSYINSGGEFLTPWPNYKWSSTKE